jgi:hypothetical protein
MMRHINKAPWILLAATSLWAGWVLVAVSDAGVALPFIFVEFFGGVFYAGLTVTFLFIFIARAIRRREPLRRAVVPALRIQMTLLAMVAVGATTDLAFVARLKVSQGSLERAAHEAYAGRLPITPRRIGLFAVREVDVIGHAVRFLTTDCGLDECGVVFSERGEPPVKGEDGYRHLQGPWWHWHRSW